MAKQTRWEAGFDAGALVCIVAMLRLEGYRIKETAMSLFKECNINIANATEEDKATLREFGLID